VKVLSAVVVKLLWALSVKLRHLGTISGARKATDIGRWRRLDLYFFPLSVHVRASLWKKGKRKWNERAESSNMSIITKTCFYV